ncbi:ketopantoate reductase-like protein [Trametes punicea]|nr:ketopantoate reductase-like protein [Trametes punicea]
MRIHVVGLGAIGTFVAFHLRRSLAPRHSVVALHRLETAKLIQQKPDGAPLAVERDGTLVSQDGVVHLPYGEPRTRSRKSDFAPAELDARDDPAVRNALGPIESLIVTTKAYAVPSVVEILREHISRNSTIVLLHNGMGVYEKLITDVFPEPNDRPNFVFASNTHGLYSVGTLHSVHTAVGTLRLGIVPDTFGRDYEASYRSPLTDADAKLSLDDIANVSAEQDISPRYLTLRNTIAALTNSPGLRAVWERFYDVQIAMRAKLVVNAFINPVSALLQCKNGDVLASAYGQSVADRVCREAERVFQAQWAAEQNELRDKVPGIKPVLSYPRELKAEVMRKEIERVVELTKNNYSSMYMDVKLRRPTEIDFINGYIIELGKKHKYRPIMNLGLAHLIKMRGAIPLV